MSYLKKTIFHIQSIACLCIIISILNHTFYGLFQEKEARKDIFMTKLDHAAIRTVHYEEAQTFFKDVFNMHMWREIGEKPGRKCWFKEGIQLCEATEISVSAENGYDHISLAVDSVPEIMKKIKAYPVTPINDHWFSLPNGTKIELKLLSDWKLNEG